MSEIRGHLMEMVDHAAQGLTAVSHRKMFGCDAWFSRGQIFSLIWKTGRVAVRLPDGGVFDEAMGLEGAEVWSVGAKMKPMSHWVLLPEGYNDDEEEVAVWVKRAHGLAKTAPMKPASKKKARK